jgi:hypothetical protein
MGTREPMSGRPATMTGSGDPINGARVELVFGPAVFTTQVAADVGHASTDG